jgi:hypothetical protein
MNESSTSEFGIIGFEHIKDFLEMRSYSSGATPNGYQLKEYSNAGIEIFKIFPQ